MLAGVLFEKSPHEVGCDSGVSDYEAFSSWPDVAGRHLSDVFGWMWFSCFDLVFHDVTRSSCQIFKVGVDGSLRVKRCVREPPLLPSENVGESGVSDAASLLER